MNEPPLQATTRAMRDMSSYLAYGSPSIGTWTKACEDSLAASQRRRAERKTVASLLDWVMRVLLVLFIILAAWAIATIYTGGSYK